MTTIIETGIMLGGEIIKRAEEFKALKLSKKTMLRAYYFEVSSNLDLLETIDLGRLNDHTVNTCAIKSLVKNLEIQIASTILFPDDKISRQLFELFNKEKPVEETDETDEAKTVKKNRTIMQSIVFTIRKITLLQKLSSFKEVSDDSIINPLRIKVRIKNIIEHLRNIQIALKEINEQEKFLFQGK